METQTTPNTKMNAIERALAAARARKAAQTAEPEQVAASEETKPTQKLTLEERAAAKVKRDEVREARKAASEEKLKALAEEKAKKKAEKAARKAEKATVVGAKPAHMKKVDRARSKLPALSEEAARIFDEAVSNLSIQQIEALAGHLVVQARAMRTMAATKSVAPPLGSTVRITGGDPKFVGLTGEVVHSQKLRLLVKVEGVKKPVYIYTGEAEVFTPAVEESAAE